MAEAILYNVASEIIMLLGSGALQQIALWWGVKGEIEKLKETVTTIRAVLLDAEEKQAQDNQIRVWLDSLQEALGDAEDLLSDFSTEALRRERMKGAKMTKEVRVFFSSSNQFVYGRRMGKKINDLREKLTAINENRKFHLEKRDVEKVVTMTRMRDQTDSSMPDYVIGREAEKKSILEFVMDPDYEENVSMISIVGIGGMGKTALAQLIFNDEEVKTHFVLKLWVCVSDPFDVKMIVRKILESANNNKQEDMEMNTLKNHLEEKINGKKYLLVLDDVWNRDYQKWLHLRKYLRGGARGSKIIVTTRFQKVGELVSTTKPYSLNRLSDDESWLLFTKLAFGQGGVKKTQRLEELGREIVNKCVGVPLAIRTIGTLLYTMKTEAQWLSFKDKELSKIDQSVDGIIPTLKLSYDHLPSPLKHCFAYCRLFPKDHRIDVEALIELWIAEGFIVSPDPKECVEDVGRGYFRELLWRSFLQEVERDYLGNVVWCKMHDLMHDLAVRVAGSESELIVKEEDVDGIDKRKVRHVSFGYNFNLKKEIPGQLIEASRLRTFMLPCQDPYLSNEEQWRKTSLDIVSNFKHLRSLDLHNLGIEEVPSLFKRFKNLTSLDLSQNRKIKVLPDSITKLQNLQVLKLKGCSSLRELPRDVTKLTNLGHLDCSDCVALRHMPSGLGQLTSLRRLPWFVVGKSRSSSGTKYNESGGLAELSGLNNLRGELWIRNLGNVREGVKEFKAANLAGKQLLQSLDLDWGRGHGYDWSTAAVPIDDNNDYEEKCLEALQPHSNLKSLSISSYGGVRLPSWLSSLRNLVIICIFHCGRCRHLPPLHQFSSLQDLWISGLDELEYVDHVTEDAESLSSPSQFFPSLQKLHVLNCPKLKGWWKVCYFESGDDDDHGDTDTTTSELPHFPCLSSLEIRNCPKLIQMPMFPSVETHVHLENSSLEPLRQTVKMKITSITSSSASSAPAPAPTPAPPLSKLKELSIKKIAELKSLPEEWLQNLDSLQELEISNCPNLKSLPQGINSHLASLRRLDISKCPQLKERCGNKNGADWRHISRIPSIRCDSRYVQKEGRYLLDDGRR